MTAGSFPNNGERRAKDGCIITFENSEGKRLVLHMAGAPLSRIGEMCDTALAHDQTFRVISYSVPATIFADMTGGRADFQSGDGHTQRATFPEKAVLSKLDMLDMLHPRLMNTGIDERVRANDLERNRQRRKKRAA